MAILILGKSKCSICHAILAEGDDIVGTQHFISDETDPLWQFSDSGMHRNCLETWEHRDEFVSRYQTRMGGLYPNSHYETWPDSNIVGRTSSSDEVYSGYTNEELNDTALPEYPDRGNYCPKCTTFIPVFASISPDMERSIRLLTDWNQQMDEVQKRTSCPSRWAKIWLNHPDGPEQEFGHPDAPPCPKCGKQLRTSRAKQCVECGADWH